VSRSTAASVPVIAIDGPTASGKGTVAARVAQELGYHYLDSGSLYRLVALRALEEGIPETDAEGLARLAARMQPRFLDSRVELDRRDVTHAIRTEDVSRAASRVAVHAPVRAALRDLQLSFRRPPGLVADGRDMGTVVFPSADLKIFLTASLEARAERRYKQLIEKGLTANMRDLLADLRVRDERDSTRATAPLKPAEDAYRLDSSKLTIDEVVAQILAWYRDR